MPERAFLSIEAVRDLRQMKLDIETLKTHTHGPGRRRAVGGGGRVVRYCLLRRVVNDLVLSVSGVTLTDDSEEIEVDDEETEVRPEPGIPGHWYRPLIWTGPPSMQATFLYLTRIDGFVIALQKVKFPLVEPPDPSQFPPGGCFLRGG